MCGIAGYLLPKGQAEPARVRAMCNLIRHRGPDDEGFYVDANCALGMRRLSIIDLATGHQPISNEDRSVWVVFNGEIYNHRELCRELTAQGHRFATHSDTEVLVHLYEQLGVEGITKLRGMFAYAVWDTRKQELLLVRDRFGKKPLYYAALPTGLYFASELKCLREAGIPLELDRDALRLYLQLSYIPDPASPYLAVRKLPPGSWLRYHADGRLEEGRYWRFPLPTRESAPALSEPEICRHVRETFDESVRLRMIADVPLGAFLSGGIDSSSVVASMARQSKEPVKTFSIGFEETAYNELPYAAMVARKFKTEHHEIVVHPDAVDLASKLVRHFDEPFGDASAIPTYLVSEFAARHVKVALTGDGGDELFCGYDLLFEVARLRHWDRVPQSVRRLISRFSEWLPYSAYGKNYLRMVSRPSALERYLELSGTPYFLRKRLLHPDWVLNSDAPFLERAFPDCLSAGDAGPVSQAYYFDATANLTGDILVKVDRMSMANSLEVRSPLLDHKLAELAAQIPFSLKMRNGRGKHILIQSIGGRLPPELLRLPKKGFGVPLSIWFRGSLRAFIWDHLTSSRLRQRDIVSPDFVAYLLREHMSGRRDNSHSLWRLLMLELWFRDQEEKSVQRVESAGTLSL